MHKATRLGKIAESERKNAKLIVEDDAIKALCLFRKDKGGCFTICMVLLRLFFSTKGLECPFNI